MNKKTVKFSLEPSDIFETAGDICQEAHPVIPPPRPPTEAVFCVWTQDKEMPIAPPIEPLPPIDPVVA